MTIKGILGTLAFCFLVSADNLADVILSLF